MKRPRKEVETPKMGRRNVSKVSDEFNIAEAAFTAEPDGRSSLMSLCRYKVNAGKALVQRGERWEVENLGQKDNETCLLLEDGIKASNLVALGVNKGALWLTGDDISGLLGQWQQLANLFQTV